MNNTELFNRLWTGYIEQNPDARRVFELISQTGEEVVNDHIAFRTFDRAGIDINTLEKPFLRAGFIEKGQYVFEQKHLFAKHYEHPEMPNAPRVFISQLISSDFSQFLQDQVDSMLAAIPDQLKGSEELIFAGNAWGPPSWSIYEQLRLESEYAAWLYVNGFAVNHFTVSVTHLKKLNNIYDLNAYLKQHGFKMNDAGGEVQGSAAELLEQSSIKAGLQKVNFVEGEREIPGCYYEFAKRYPDSSGKLYSGFIAKSADKIFQSTDYYKQ